MSKDAQHWSGWFWGTFISEWLARVQDDQGGVFDTLDANGNPDLSANKTLLSQARTLFTLSHIALETSDPVFVAAARRQFEFLRHYQKAPGFYRWVIKRDGTPTGVAADEYARSYDHSFVILGLVTWNKVSPSKEVRALIEQCWTALTSCLCDPVTGLLQNDDSGAKTGPAQNPHMHLYEACLQAFRMTDDAIWLKRAVRLRMLGLRYFMDEATGSIAEFLTPDLRPLSGIAGDRREVGHQCEWAWLLYEEATLTNETGPLATAERLVSFAAKSGFVPDGILKGAVVDAISASGDIIENSFLLWPQTEAIKVLAVRHAAGYRGSGNQARALMSLMFERWFADHPSFINQLDADGVCIWPQGLTRLMYHVVLAMTEGARAELWSNAATPLSQS